VAVLMGVDLAAASDPDEPISTSLLLVKPAKLLKFVSKYIIVPLPTADPTVDGAMLQILDGTGLGTGDNNAYALPAANWVALGTPPGSNGYRYKGAGTIDDPCTLVLLKTSVIKAVCKGPGVTLITPFSGHAVIVLTVGGPTNSKRYCAEAGGMTKRNNIKLLKRVAAPNFGICPATLPPPPPPDRLCVLDGATSALVLWTAALGALPPLPVNGTISLACGISGPDGVAACACDVGAFAPVIIPAIGDICLSASDPCPAGKIDCDGGEPMDIDVRAVHVTSVATACTGNGACDASCLTYCAGLGASSTEVQHGCEGFCLGGTNDDAACTLPSDCPGGLCIGSSDASPSPPQHPGRCNCTCAGTSGVSAAGAFACNLGIQLSVELPTDGDCTDADTIQLRPFCMPLTTATSTGLITTANFMGGNTIPPAGMPDTVTGASVSCLSFDAGTLTGMQTAGHIVGFDSTLGDTLWSLTFTCQ
jgi:hypothetical protein